MGEFSGLSYADIETIVTTLTGCRNTMSDILNGVKEQIKTVGEGGAWSGNVATAKREEFDALAAKFVDFTTAIEDCEKHLTQTVERFKAVDSALEGAAQ